MNQFVFYIREAYTDLIKNKGRAFLTSLGIIIGVYSVILLLALGEGLKGYLKDQFASFGTYLVFIMPGSMSGPSMMGGKQYTYSDYTRLKTGIPEAEVAPAVLKSATAVTKLDEKLTTLVGTTREAFPIRNLTLESGRYFSKSEETSGRKVVIIGPAIAEDLFGNQNPLNKKVKIQDLTFTVIGILEKKGGGALTGGSNNPDAFMYAPYKAVHLFTTSKTFLAFYLQANSDEEVEIISKKAERIMLMKYKADDFEVTTEKELLDTISQIFGVVNSLLVGIAAISLLVGGVGITNIMYVTVTERIKEIGIRRAIGAQEKNILMQFLALAVMLTSVGGFIGIGLAYLTTLAIYNIFPAKITLSAVALSFLVSFVIGIIFGVFPARKAAKLSPVEAIRYE